MKIIAFGNQKGGVGKTALTFSLSRMLGLRGKKVLVVDSDSQTNLTTAFNINADAQALTLTDVLLNKVNEENYQAVIVRTDLANVDIMPASILLDDVEHKLVTETKREYRFTRFLAKCYDALNETYDYMLIDTKPQKSIINLNMFLVADEVILVTDIDISSVAGLKQQLEWWQLKRSADELDEQIDNMNYIIMNNVEEKTRMFKEIEEFFIEDGAALNEIKTLKTYISKTTAQKNAIASGCSLIELDNKHKVSMQYEQLLQELISRGIL